MLSTAEEGEKLPPVDGMVGARENLIFGWLVDLHDRSRKRLVEIFVGGRSIGVAKADRHHEVAIHGGHGNYGFAFYYSHAPDEGPTEVTAVERESKTPLRWKRPPLLTRSERTGPPLTVDGLRIAEKVFVVGTIGAYPGKHVTLEVWRKGERLNYEIPLSLPKRAGPFEAELPPEVLQQILSTETELALPGLKEAGLAVPLRDLLAATVTSDKGKLRIEFLGHVEVTGQVPLTLRLTMPDGAPIELAIAVSSRVAAVGVPKGYSLEEGSVEIFLGKIAIPTSVELEFLHDRQFESLGQSNSLWSHSENTRAERGFFAFPSSLSGQFHLSGDVARVSSHSPTPSLVLRQCVPKEAARSDVIIVVARASKGARIVARFVVGSSLLSQETATVESDTSWHLLKLKIDALGEFNIDGDLWFEVEAAGDNVEVLEVAIGDPRDAALAAEPVASNLLSNPDLELWPEGVGIRRHIGRGEIAAGWRLLNKDCVETVFTRAIIDPTDSTIGMAIAAPHVAKWLRIEADLKSAGPLSEMMLVSFRAGVPAAARQLLANELSPVPKFTVIHAITIIRRTHTAGAGSSSTRERVIARTPRKITIRRDVERFVIPTTVDLQHEKAELGPPDQEGVTETYHLAFEFRESAVLGLFGAELLPQCVDVSADPPKLQLEDSNIELQISELVGLESWTSNKAAIRSSSQRPTARQLKWSIDASREPVEIIIPVFNALPETLGCLQSLIGSTRVPILVRLVDDGSEEPVREALAAFAADKPWVELHSLATNRGYTYAADFGVRQAAAEWVVLLNSDTIVTCGWLEGLLACAQSDPETAFVGPISNAASFQSVPELYDASGKWKVNSLPAGMTPDDMAAIVARVSQHAYPEVPLLNGFCTLIRRSTFIELGGLNTAAFPMGYGEENDLCLRARKAGYKLAVADDVYVYHVKSASFGSARRTALSKAGNLALRELHPDVDIGVLTKQFRETLPLVALREAVARALAAHDRGLGADAVRAADESPIVAGEPANTPEIQTA